MNWGKKAFVEMGILLVILLVGIGSAALFLDHALSQENVLCSRRLQKSFAPLIDKAHRAKDDLALQEFVAALAQAPGVPFAYIEDPETKILAHSRLNQIGKLARATRGDDAPVWHYALKEESQSWGTLKFALSKRTTEKLWLKSVVGLFAFGGGLLLLYGLRLVVYTRARHQLNAALTDAGLLLAEERAQNARLLRRLETDGANARAALAAALNRLSEGAILLDGQQRVLMMNHLGQEALPLEREMIGCSWQDVPALRDHGTELERSLQSVGHVVALDKDRSGTVFLTEAVNGIQLTWVMPKPVLRASQ